MQLRVHWAAPRCVRTKFMVTCCALDITDAIIYACVYLPENVCHAMSVVFPRHSQSTCELVRAACHLYFDYRSEKLHREWVNFVNFSILIYIMGLLGFHAWLTTWKNPLIAFCAPKNETESRKVKAETCLKQTFNKIQKIMQKWKGSQLCRGSSR